MKPTKQIPSRILLTDRSTIETDQTCGMARWWYKEEGGQGISPAAEPVYFAQGRQIHEDMAGLAESSDPLAWVKELENSYSEHTNAMSLQEKELHYRRFGWLYAYAIFHEPKIREEYENLAVEQELVLDRDPLWIECIPDRVLVHRVTGKMVYQEYKTAKTINKGWVESWPYAIQIHLGLQAATEEYQKPLAFGQIIGLVKGVDRDGRLSHPYVYGYVGKSGGWSSAYKTGLTPTGVWEYPEGIEAWVRKCGDETAASMFPRSLPIFLNTPMVEKLVSARLYRERVIESVREECRDDLNVRSAYFEPCTKQCKPVIGQQCAYLAACHNAQTGSDPIGSGMYVTRTPHHELEILKLKGAANE